MIMRQRKWHEGKNQVSDWLHKNALEKTEQSLKICQGLQNHNARYILLVLHFIVRGMTREAEVMLSPPGLQIAAN